MRQKGKLSLWIIDNNTAATRLEPSVRRSFLYIYFFQDPSERRVSLSDISSGQNVTHPFKTNCICHWSATGSCCLWCQLWMKNWRNFIEFHLRISSYGIIIQFRCDGLDESFNEVGGGGGRDPLVLNFQWVEGQYYCGGFFFLHFFI